jgi:hypothetical protein
MARLHIDHLDHSVAPSVYIFQPTGRRVGLTRRVMGNGFLGVGEVAVSFRGLRHCSPVRPPRGVRVCRLSTKPTGHAAHLLQIVQNTLADSSVQVPRDLGLPFGTPVVTRDQVSAEALKAQFVGAEKEDKNAFRAQLSRALSSLSGDGFIGMRDNWIWMSEAK